MYTNELESGQILLLVRNSKNTVLHKYGFSLEMLYCTEDFFLFTDKKESHNKIITLKTEEEQKQNTKLFTNHFFCHCFFNKGLKLTIKSRNKLGQSNIRFLCKQN